MDINGIRNNTHSERETPVSWGNLIYSITKPLDSSKYDKKAMLIQRQGNCIFTNISKGTAFLLQGLTENDSKGKNVTI